MRINEETANTLRLILLDHRDCISAEEYQMQSGEEVLRRLEMAGLPLPPCISAEEIDSKANLLWEIDQLTDLLEAGDDQDDTEPLRGLDKE